MESNDEIKVYVRSSGPTSKPKKRGCIAVAPACAAKPAEKSQSEASYDEAKIEKQTEKDINISNETSKTGLWAKLFSFKRKKAGGARTRRAHQKIENGSDFARVWLRNFLCYKKGGAELPPPPEALGRFGSYAKYRRIAVAAAAPVVLLGGMYFSGYSLGCDVYVNGSKIATVHSQSDYKNILNKVNGEIKALTGRDGDINPQVSFVTSIVPKNGYTSEASLSEKLKGMSNQLIDAYAVYVDGKAAAALKDGESANMVLEKLKGRYTAGRSDISAQFVNNVEVRRQHVPVSLYMSEDAAFNQLSGDVQVDGVYEVKDADTLWGISKIYGMSVQTLMSLNPGITDSIRSGQRLKVKQPKPLINIKTVEKAVYQESVPCQVQNVNDPNLYVGKSNVINPGKDGVRQVEAEIVKINGVETSRNILSSSMLIEPEAKVVSVGVKPVPSGIGTGVFSRPYYGVITSRFGARWGGRHTGIDIAGPTGDPIYAADQGKVTFTGVFGGYGNLVILNHNNGYETWYGHMSKISVATGDTVQKNDVLGFIGSTGVATGPHLHFEVRKGGVPQNPLDYLK